MPSQHQHYHPIAKYLHWVIAAMIVLQFVLAKLAENAATPLQELALLANHKSVGITIFALAVARLDAGLFDVSVAVAAVETLDDDRDRTLQDPEWFDFENYPQVRYQASRIQSNAAGAFEALGALTAKGRTTPVSLHSTVSKDDSIFVLDGTADLDRLVFELGLGEWSDTRWIGQFVAVSVHVEANTANYR